LPLLPSRPSRPPRRLAGLPFIVALVLASFALRCDDRGFQEGEIHCERARFRLEECCPGVVTSDRSCDDIPAGTGCDSETAVVPLFRRPQADCIVSLSCAELVSEGICAAYGGLTGDSPDAARAGSAGSATGPRKCQ
jgi:hypothetical protein